MKSVSKKSSKFIFQSSKETQAFAKVLASEILNSKKRFPEKQSIVLCLSGNLGAGKTTFTQGFLRALGVKQKVTSPSFLISKRYRIKLASNCAGVPALSRVEVSAFHIDCYRFKNPSDFVSLGILDALKVPGNIFLIEWPEKIKKFIPKDAIRLRFSYGKKENERKIQCESSLCSNLNIN